MSTIPFELNDEQTEKFDAWNDEHKPECHANTGASGGRLTFSFTPTGLGIIANASCVCGAARDLTDFSEW